MDFAFALIYAFVAGLALGALLTAVAVASGVFRREPRLRAVRRAGAGGVVLAFDPTQPRRRPSARASRVVPAPSAERHR